MFSFREITNHPEWDFLLANFPDRTFLQSWEWGELQALLGHKIWRWRISRGDRVIGCSLIIKIAARRGTFILVPHGPLIVENEIESVLPYFVEESRKLAEIERAGWIRINPLFLNNSTTQQLFTELGFRRAPLHVHPEQTWILNLKKTEDELFAGMRDTMRNLIRKGVRIQELGVRNYGNDKEGLEIFWKLYKTTAERQHFTPFDYSYLEKETQTFGEKTAVFLAEHQGKPLAGAFIIFDGGNAFYHHGASLHSKIPASYVLHWEIIREAKQRGCRFYNFWGIAPMSKVNGQMSNVSKHPWHGLTLFKMGFGGEPRYYLPTQDLVLENSYWINWIVETVRRVRRRY